MDAGSSSAAAHSGPSNHVLVKVVGGPKNGRVRVTILACPECGASFASKSLLLAHMKQRGHGLRCATCGWAFLSRGACKQHQRKKGHASSTAANSNAAVAHKPEEDKEAAATRQSLLQRQQAALLSDFAQKLWGLMQGLSQENMKADKTMLAQLREQQTKAQENLKSLCGAMASASSEGQKAAQRLCEEQLAAIRQEREDWEKEKQHISNVNGLQPKVVKVNVGGHVFTTSSTTMCMCTGSMLEAMFSGRHALTPMEDGSVFIDRDPTHFRTILNYLRGNKPVLPENQTGLEELLQECEFYGLAPLASLVRKALESVS
ncbi:SH3KBP1-binding protein 1 [Balamuthia mandrillaris]